MKKKPAGDLKFQLTIDSDVLRTELNYAKSAIDSKSLIPILGTVKLEAVPDRCLLSATNLDIAIRTDMAAKVVQEGICLLPLKAIISTLATFKRSTPIQISADGERVGLEWDGGRVKLPQLAETDFPSLPEMPDAAVEVDGPALESVIRRVVFAIPGEDSKYVSGALFEIEEELLRAVTTDGHRIALATCRVKGKSFPDRLKNPSFLVPRSVLELVGHLDPSGDVAISTDETRVFMQIGKRQIMGRKPVGQFPNYQKVIPTDNPGIFQADRAALTEVISRAATQSDARSHAVILELSAKPTITADGFMDGTEYSENLPANYVGDDLRIGFNSRYLLEFLRVMESDAVTFRLNGEEAPAVFEDDGAKYVVMPMRI